MLYGLLSVLPFTPTERFIRDIEGPFLQSIGKLQYLRLLFLNGVADIRIEFEVSGSAADSCIELSKGIDRVTKEVPTPGWEMDVEFKGYPWVSS